MRSSSRRASRDTGAIEVRIREALIGLRPLLHFPGATIELVAFEVEGGIAVLRLAGDCPDCQLTAAMLRQGIEAHLRMQVPEVQEVRAI